MQDLRGLNILPNLDTLNQNNIEEPVEPNIDINFIMNSSFDFYLNSRLITSDLCLRRHFEHLFLNIVKDVTFSNPYYAKNVCPYVFMNSPIVL